VENWFDGNLHRRWTYQPERHDTRLLSETSALLELLEGYHVQATFFILGTVARDHADLVRRIAGAGHEIASHAWTHDVLRDSTPQRYLDGLHRSRAVLQDLSGQPVLGHRAPSWSIDRGVPWAIEALLEAGFAYDSSVFPMKTPLYGEPGFPTTPCWLAGRDGTRLLEFPPAVRRFGPLSVPFGGGLYWRLLPLWGVEYLLRHANTPAVTYLHPWELNAEPIALPPALPLMPRLALRYGVRTAGRRFAALLENHSFEPFRTALARWNQTDSLPIVSL
jgi:polysaccharide deacetylase family protein (PEP-CTERM system associated)